MRRCEVDAVGSTWPEIEAHARKVAAPLFGIDPRFVDVDPDFIARPRFMDGDGRVSLWEASVSCSADDDDPRDRRPRTTWTPPPV